MANIKRGFKRIERVLLVLGCLGVLLTIMQSVSLSTAVLALFIPMCFAPYIVFKVIVWLVMGFKDENIKKGLKRIEWVLLVLGVLVFWIVLPHLEDYPPWDYQRFFYIILCYAPYFVFKLIKWIVMGFLNDDEVK